MLPANFNRTSAVLFEQLVNRLLALDAEAHQKLLGFHDKTIHLNISDFELDYYLTFPAGTVVIQTNCQRLATASISGKLAAFIAAASAQNSGDAIFTGELHFSGEINTASRFQQFAQSLQIDWQQPLSQLFGDIAAHNIARGLSHLGQFFGQVIDNVRQDIPDYLQHEIQVTPCANELEIFLGEVDLIRSQTDRLQARIQRLQAND